MNFASLDPAMMFTLLLALGALSAVGAFGVTLVHRDQTSARLKMITERRRELARDAVDALRGKAGALPRQRRWSTLQTIVSRLRLLQADSLAKLKEEMVAAGWRDPSTPALFITGVCIFPLILGGIGLIWANKPSFANHGMMQLLVPVGMASLGVLLPRLWLVNTVTKRRQAIGKSFPDALDLMVICVEAGLSAEAAFNRVTDEMVGSSPAIAEEFGLLAAELAFLPDRRKPLENLATRTGMPAMKSLSTTLLQSEKYGTPVALGLRVLGQENREARLSAAEKKAAALPAKLTVPMIVFFLPVLFAIIGGPAYIRATALN
jgi:tight adherence protein C